MELKGELGNSQMLIATLETEQLQTSAARKQKLALKARTKSHLESTWTRHRRIHKYSTHGLINHSRLINHWSDSSTSLSISKGLKSKKHAFLTRKEWTQSNDKLEIFLFIF